MPARIRAARHRGERNNRFDEDQAERIPGPEIGDYLGLPINASARLHADSWDASLLTIPEHQCKPHPSDYGIRGPAEQRVWKEVDTATQKLIAYHTLISWQRCSVRSGWMEGRTHPTSPRTPGRASPLVCGTATLVITTTHLKTGWIRQEWHSAQRESRGDAMIRHEKYLTVATIIDDPAYLTQPFIRTDGYFCESGRR